MHEFPSSQELDFLVGDTLAQICFDPYSTQFRFETNHITAEFAVEHEADGKVWHYECVAAQGPALMLHRLVGKKVVALDSQGLRLSISFEDGAILHVLSDIGPYEAGHIAGSGKIVIF